MVKKLRNSKGFLTIISILVMGTLLTISTSLIYIIKMNNLLVKSNRKNIQHYYIGEGKIYKTLYTKQYFNQILQLVRTYLRNKNPGPWKITMETEDLIGQDVYRDIEVGFTLEDNRHIIRLETIARIGNVSKKVNGRFNIIKEVYELGVPILYPDILNESLKKELENHLEELEDLKLANLDHDIMDIELVECNKVILSEDSEGRKFIGYFQDKSSSHMKKIYINKNKFFLALKEDVELIILPSEMNYILGLNGIIYTEGNVKIEGSLDFKGILILNGGSIDFILDHLFTMEGILLSKKYPFSTLSSEENIKIVYNRTYIEDRGYHIPGYIDFNLKNLQIQ